MDFFCFDVRSVNSKYGSDSEGCVLRFLYYIRHVKLSNFMGK
jgi:hypothetical protein